MSAILRKTERVAEIWAMFLCLRKRLEQIATNNVFSVKTLGLFVRPARFRKEKKEKDSGPVGWHVSVLLSRNVHL